MNLKKSDIKFTYYRGQGPGGQHKNKTENACRALHVPSGISACADCRKRTESRRQATKNLKEKLIAEVNAVHARMKAKRRKDLIENSKRIRTYDFKKGIVIDHQSGKTASLKEVLEKGRLDLVRKDI